MNKIKPMLAGTFKKQKVSGYWMSEKLDGVRAIWDGEKFVSRNGKVFFTPDAITSAMPKNIILDGELWEGRGIFQETVGKVRSHEGDWSTIKFMIFDAITDKPFESRGDTLKATTFPSFCELVGQTQCKGPKHLKKYEAEILDQGGEGVMLRAPQSPYEYKRSKYLLKVKRFKTKEATVIGHTDGKGKHLGVTGALICKYMGKIFQIGSGLSDLERSYPPSIGDIVTFSFFELTTAGVPRFPSYVSVRDYE